MQSYIMRLNPITHDYFIRDSIMKNISLLFAYIISLFMLFLGGMTRHFLLKEYRHRLFN